MANGQSGKLPVLDDVSVDQFLPHALGADGRVGGDLLPVAAESLPDQVAAGVVHQPEGEDAAESGQDGAADLRPVRVQDLIDVLGPDDELQAQAPAEVDPVADVRQLRQQRELVEDQVDAAPAAAPGQPESFLDRQVHQHPVDRQQTAADGDVVLDEQGASALPADDRAHREVARPAERTRESVADRLLEERADRIRGGTTPGQIASLAGQVLVPGYQVPQVLVGSFELTSQVSIGVLLVLVPGHRLQDRVEDIPGGGGEEEIL